MTQRLDGRIDADLGIAAALLRDGGLVAFPTETVYGLGADGLDPAAVAGVFAAKGRPADNPLILHVASFEQALALWQASPEQLALARRLADAFWPGPLTMVLPVRPETVPLGVTAGLDSVAVRMPADAIALALIERTGHPLAAPSANASGRPSPTTADHVLRTLDGRIDAVVDGGPTHVGLESTVVDLRGAQVRVLREGGIARAQIADVLGEAVAGPDPAGGGGEAVRAPGMRHRHYAPEGVSARIVPATVVHAAWTGATAVLCRAALAAACEAELGAREAVLEVLPDDAQGYARGLYAALHRLEQAVVSDLLIERLPADDDWRAVRDRIERAATG
ncbi:MAG TPA: L-threonylcarbamoyladenylate synthase [Pseudomonadales bacterium]|nr:L-threonylcarbamoyladenylate synthase [Pseudomonadales bacterium]